ncbi:MAG: helix-turn-helix transcriptional regulator [Treponema sp.]|nr:helix-turn-helix transcriptional regulator [Treponema sp.]
MEEITIPLEVYRALTNTVQKFMESQNKYINFVERTVACLNLIQEYYALKSPEVLSAYFEKTEEELRKSGIVVEKDDKFYDLLRKFRDRAGMEEVDLYTRAGLSKAVFSNIRSGKSVPKQENVLSLALTLKLSLSETKLLLERAGHAFVPGSIFSKIITDALRQNVGTVDDVNEVLVKNGLEPLGSKVR